MNTVEKEEALKRLNPERMRLLRYILVGWGGFTVIQLALFWALSHHLIAQHRAGIVISVVCVMAFALLLPIVIKGDKIQKQIKAISKSSDS